MACVFDAAGVTPLRRLGVGGMGEVFAVAAVGTGARYALKVLRAGADREALLRFRREAEAQAAVDGHPNVVRIHSAGTAEGHAYLVMDWAGGGDLQRRLDAGPLPPRHAAELVRDLAAGLAHVHAAGVLHRDLKPANVVFDERGVPKLVDFGLARHEDSERLTQTGAVMGTPGFMAPEQIEPSGQTAGVSADVYGLGAVLFASLTGRAPFVGSSPYLVMFEVLKGKPSRPRDLVPTIPADLEAVCLRALSRDPNDRHASASALRGDLERCLSGGAARGGGVRGAAVAVVVACVAGGAWALSGGRSAKPDDGVAHVPSRARVATDPLRSARDALTTGDAQRALEVATMALSNGPDATRERELKALRGGALLLLGRADEARADLPKAQRFLIEIDAKTRALQRKVSVLSGDPFEWRDAWREGYDLFGKVAPLRRHRGPLEQALAQAAGESIVLLLLRVPSGRSVRGLGDDTATVARGLFQAGDPRCDVLLALLWVRMHTPIRTQGALTWPTVPTPEAVSGRWEASARALGQLRDLCADPTPARWIPTARPPALEETLLPLERTVHLELADSLSDLGGRQIMAQAEQGLVSPETFLWSLRWERRHLELAEASVGLFLDNFNHALIDLASLERCAGRLASSQARLEAVPGTTPTVRQLIRLVQAEIHLARGQFARAHESVDAVDDPWLDTLTLRARIAQAEGQPARARELFEAAKASGLAVSSGLRGLELTKRLLDGHDPWSAVRAALATRDQAPR